MTLPNTPAVKQHHGPLGALHLNFPIPSGEIHLALGKFWETTIEFIPSRDPESSLHSGPAGRYPVYIGRARNTGAAAVNEVRWDRPAIRDNGYGVALNANAKQRAILHEGLRELDGILELVIPESLQSQARTVIDAVLSVEALSL